MKDSDAKHDEIARLLATMRVPEPSEQLRNRVTEAARAAWNEGPADVPWQIPLRRLALSAAAVLLITSLTNRLTDPARSRPPTSTPVATGVPSPELDDLTEAVYGPLRRRLRVNLGKPPGVEAATLRNRLETEYRLLNEIENSRNQTPPTPGAGRSRLPQCQPDMALYS